MVSQIYSQLLEEQTLHLTEESITLDLNELYKQVEAIISAYNREQNGWDMYELSVLIGFQTWK